MTSEIYRNPAINCFITLMLPVVLFMTADRKSYRIELPEDRLADFVSYYEADIKAFPRANAEQAKELIEELMILYNHFKNHAD